MKRLVKIIIRYKLYMPLPFIRLLYFNLIRFNRAYYHCCFFPTRHSVFDISKTAKIIVRHSVLFGWCNMKHSRLETALYMADGSTLILGGANSKAMELVGYGSYIHVGNNATLRIGNSFINREVKIVCNKEITIGDGCVIAMGTVIRDNDGGNHQILTEGYQNQKPVMIGDHVWIGENSMILKGVTIGEGAVVAASSLVTKNVPPHCLVAGSPAKVLRENVNWEA